MKKISVIITGVTGMVGEGVLHECILSDKIDRILVFGRRPCGIAHPKVKEVVHSNFLDISPVADQLKGYDACFFCLGVSSVGMKEPEFHKMTYTLTMHVAETISTGTPGMVFCYVSGKGTDTTEKGSVMWARVKGRTENDLMKLPFRHVYNFRPGLMRPTPGLKNTLKAYKYIAWLYPVLRKLTPGYASTLAEVGLAMIHVATAGYPKQILEVKDIVAAAKEEAGS